jgi:hypothetical protein
MVSRNATSSTFSMTAPLGAASLISLVLRSLISLGLLLR